MEDTTWGPKTIGGLVAAIVVGIFGKLLHRANRGASGSDIRRMSTLESEVKMMRETLDRVEAMAESNRKNIGHLRIANQDLKNDIEDQYNKILATIHESRRAMLAKLSAQPPDGPHGPMAA